MVCSYPQESTRIVCGICSLQSSIVAMCWKYLKYSYLICCNTGISDAGDVRFSLNGTTYQNNSLVTLEDVGEGDDALLCITDQTACCRPPYTGETGSVIGSWFFPNGTRVPSSGAQWDIYRTSGWKVMHLHRRRGGEDGIYHCVIPDTMNVPQTKYIGVYAANTGE